MEVLIVVICTLFVAGIAAALVYKAVTMAKEMKKYRQELEKSAITTNIFSISCRKARLSASSARTSTPKTWN